MSWFKKKTEVQDEVKAIPLIEQPLQMPEKTNEELLAELQKMGKLRLKTRWIPIAFISTALLAEITCFLLGAWSSLLRTRSGDPQMLVSTSAIAKSLTDTYGGYSMTVMLLAFVAFFTIQHFQSKWNSNKITHVISELVRRKETAVLSEVSRLMKFGSSSVFDSKNALYSQTLIELTPNITSEEFDKLCAQTQGFFVFLLNHPEESVREATQAWLIQNGSKKALKLVKSMQVRSFGFNPNKLNPNTFTIPLLFRSMHIPWRAMDKETFPDYVNTLKLCVDGLEARLADENKQAQLLRPSSANSDGSELLRAAQGGTPDDKPETLLRASGRESDEEEEEEEALSGIVARYSQKTSSEDTELIIEKSEVPNLQNRG